jgi:hypothetical protein
MFPSVSVIEPPGQPAALSVLGPPVPQVRDGRPETFVGITW